MPRRPSSHSQPELGKAIRYLRRTQDLTQQEMSARTAGPGEKPLGVTYLSHIERESTKPINPTPATLDKILAALNTDEETLARVIDNRLWDPSVSLEATNSYVSRTDERGSAEATYSLASAGPPPQASRSRAAAMGPARRATPAAASPSPDLAVIVEHWDSLPASLRLTLVGLVRGHLDRR